MSGSPRPWDGPGYSIRLGGQGSGLDAGDRGAFVVVRSVAGDADAADNRARCVLDQDAAGDGDQPAADCGRRRGDEVRLLFRTSHQGPRAHAERESPVRLADSDLEAV